MVAASSVMDKPYWNGENGHTGEYSFDVLGASVSVFEAHRVEGVPALQSRAAGRKYRVPRASHGRPRVALKGTCSCGRRLYIAGSIKW